MISKVKIPFYAFWITVMGLSLAMTLIFAQHFPLPFCPGDEGVWLKLSNRLFSDFRLDKVLRVSMAYLNPLLMSWAWNFPEKFSFIFKFIYGLYFLIPGVLVSQLLLKKGHSLLTSILIGLICAWIPEQIYSNTFLLESGVHFYTFLFFYSLYQALDLKSPGWFKSALFFLFLLPFAKASGVITIASFLFSFVLSVFLLKGESSVFLKKELKSVAVFFILFTVKIFVFKDQDALGFDAYRSVYWHMLHIKTYSEHSKALVDLMFGNLLTLFAFYGFFIFTFFRAFKSSLKNTESLLYWTLLFAFVGHILFTVAYTMAVEQFDHIHARYYFQFMVPLIAFGWIGAATQAKVSSSLKIIYAICGALTVWAIASHFYPLFFKPGSFVDGMELVWFYMSGSPYVLTILYLFLGVQAFAFYAANYRRVFLTGLMILFGVIHFFNYGVFASFGEGQNNRANACSSALRAFMENSKEGIQYQVVSDDLNYVSTLLFGAGKYLSRLEPKAVGTTKEVFLRSKVGTETVDTKICD